MQNSSLEIFGIRLILESYSKQALVSTIGIINNTFVQNEIKSSPFIWIPPKTFKITLHSDQHTHSKARDQYERTRYKVLINLYSDYKKIKDNLQAIKLLPNINVIIKFLQK